jgi:catechol 2,3-dioxygenase-like lactoylglutathione lyase family enzyme
MSSTYVSSDTSTPVPDGDSGDMKLAVVVLPVSDVDRAKSFYRGLGWRLDADLTRSDDFRIVQLTPRGPHARSSSGPG